MVNYTATQVKALKCPAGKKFKSFCIDSSAHLYLICYDTGTKIYKKRVKNGYITIENFKNITLATAREKALNLNQTKQKKFKINDLFFEWLDTQIPNTKENYTIRRKYINRINKWILQKIGDKFINEVDKSALLSALSGAGFQTAKKNIEIYKKLLKIAKLKDTSEFSKEFRILLKNLNIPYRRLYNMRHSYATNLLYKNLISPLELSQLLGHSTTKMVYDVYVNYIKNRFENFNYSMKIY